MVQTRHAEVNVVCGMDARGFLFGPTMACNLDAAFVPVRKCGKLPGPCEKVVYTTEYSSAESEIQMGAIKKAIKWYWLMICWPLEVHLLPLFSSFVRLAV